MCRRLPWFASSATSLRSRSSSSPTRSMIAARTRSENSARIIRNSLPKPIAPRTRRTARTPPLRFKSACAQRPRTTPLSRVVAQLPLLEKSTLPRVTGSASRSMSRWASTTARSKGGDTLRALTAMACSRKRPWLPWAIIPRSIRLRMRCEQPRDVHLGTK
eukprot:Amastigsp_a685359_13.p2 type:complete len:161 gc:universal Amastigsp_a685359_13:292-774(+)